MLQRVYGNAVVAQMLARDANAETAGVEPPPAGADAATAEVPPTASPPVLVEPPAPKPPPVDATTAPPAGAPLPTAQGEPATVAASPPSGSAGPVAPLPAAGPAVKPAAPSGARPSTAPSADGARDAAPPPAPAANTPSIANPSSGVDWTPLLEATQDPWNIVRVATELSRPIPIVGLAGGIVADAVSGGQDLWAVRNEGVTFTGLLIGARHGVNLMNNIFGQLAYLDQWVQNAATGSIVLAPADAATAPGMVAVKQFKLVLDGIQLGMDVFVLAGAAYNAAHATTPESLATWNGQLTNYEANLLGDSLTAIFDVIDLATLGFGQGESANTVVKWLKKVMELATGPYFQTIKGVLLGFAGIVGGNVPGLPTVKPVATPKAARSATGALQRSGNGALPPAATSAARQAAIAIVRSELAQIRAVYTGVDTALGVAADVQAEMVANVRARLTELLDGQDPLRMLVTSISEGLDRLNAEISQMMKMGALAADAKQRADTIAGYADDARAAVETIRPPRFELPREGSGGIIDAATDLLQEQLLDRVNNQARGLVDGVKRTALTPIATVHDNATEIADFSVIVQQTAERAVGQIQEHTAKFSAAIGRCNSIEDIVNTMIGQAFEVLGFGEGLTVADVVARWKEIGPLIDQVDAMLAAQGAPVDPDDNRANGPTPAALPADKPPD